MDFKFIEQNFYAPFILLFRFPYLSSMESLPPQVRATLTTLDKIEAMPSPRMIKSHLPLYLLHPKLLDTSKVECCIYYNLILIYYLLFSLKR